MITELLCGRASEVPADPARAGALAAMVAGELAHRVFLDADDVRIGGFARHLHRQTGADPWVLEAVLHGLLGGPPPAVGDPVTPLLVLGRGLVLELELDDREVAELVASSDERLPGIPHVATPPEASARPTAVSPPMPQGAPLPQGVPVPPGASVPPPVPQGVPLPQGVPVPRGVPVPPGSPAFPGASAAAPRPRKIYFVLGGVLAAFGVVALLIGLVVPLGGGGSADDDGDAPSDVISAPPESDPVYVSNTFAEAVNNARYDRAVAFVCGESSRLTRHIAEGVLRVKGLTVNRVETQNSTTAFVRAEATIPPQPKPLAWRGTLRNKGGKWCVLDIHPEDDSPPAQPETRADAFEKMRDFVKLVNRRDSDKAMTYVCDTPQRLATQGVVDIATRTGSRLAVKPKPGPKSASSYTGSITGRSKWGQKITGRMMADRGDDGTYCIGYVLVKYGPFE